MFTDAGAAMESVISIKISTLPHFPIIPLWAPASSAILPIMGLFASDINCLQQFEAIQAGVNFPTRLKYSNFTTHGF
jgi:hypothetical protein